MDDIERARAYALRLLKFRLRSEQELREKLAQKDFPADVVDQTVGRLKRGGLLDDELFARLWVEGRIRRPLGPHRLRRELKKKGVEPRIIEAALEAACRDYDEKETIRTLIRRKMKQAGRLDKDKIKTRLFGYCVRRGYSHGLVIETILEEIR